MNDESRIKRIVMKEIEQWDDEYIGEYVNNKIHKFINDIIYENTYDLRDKIKDSVKLAVASFVPSVINTDVVEEKVKLHFSDEKIISITDEILDWYDEEFSNDTINKIANAVIESKYKKIKEHVCAALGVECIED